MTQQQYLINRKLNIVELADTMKNITKDCKRLGASRQYYYYYYYYYYYIKAALQYAIYVLTVPFLSLSASID